MHIIVDTRYTVRCSEEFIFSLKDSTLDGVSPSAVNAQTTEEESLVYRAHSILFVV